MTSNKQIPLDTTVQLGEAGEKKKTKKKNKKHHAGHARPQKHRVVCNFLSFYPVILELGTKKNSSFSKILCFLFLRFLHFWRENDVMNCVPKFAFANMGYLMLSFERTFHKDLKTEKKF